MTSVGFILPEASYNRALASGPTSPSDFASLIGDNNMSTPSSRSSLRSSLAGPRGSPAYTTSLPTSRATPDLMAASQRLARSRMQTFVQQSLHDQAEADALREQEEQNEEEEAEEEEEEPFYSSNRMDTGYPLSYSPVGTVAVAAGTKRRLSPSIASTERPGRRARVFSSYSPRGTKRPLEGTFGSSALTPDEIESALRTLKRAQTQREEDEAFQVQAIRNRIASVRSTSPYRQFAATSPQFFADEEYENGYDLPDVARDHGGSLLATEPAYYETPMYGALLGPLPRVSQAAATRNDTGRLYAYDEEGNDQEEEEEENEPEGALGASRFSAPRTHSPLYESMRPLGSASGMSPVPTFEMLSGSPFFAPTTASVGPRPMRDVCQSIRDGTATVGEALAAVGKGAYASRGSFSTGLVALCDAAADAEEEEEANKTMASSFLAGGRSPY